MKDFTFRVLGWSIRVSFKKIIPETPPPLIKQTFQPRITRKKRKTGLTYCPVTDKVGYPEALAKLKAERLKKRTENGYLRAYHCEFCPKWHLTHHKNKLTMH